MISHGHKCVFIHIPKNAGTTIEFGILKAIGEKFDEEKFSTHPAPIFALRRDVKHKYWLKGGRGRVLGQRRKQQLYRPHAKLGQHTNAPDYFCFTFVRNPWSRLVSEFIYRRNRYGSKQHADVDFARMVRTGYIFDKKFMRDHHESYLPNGQLRYINENMDFVGKVENLQEDFEKVTNKLGLKKVILPRINKRYYKPYWEYYDDETRELIAKRFKRDIETFNYEFEK